MLIIQRSILVTAKQEDCIAMSVKTFKDLRDIDQKLKARYHSVWKLCRKASSEFRQ